jgi:hypothetical protein
MKKQQAESKKEIEALMAEIKKRQVPPDKKIPPVVVQPSGSGMAEDSKVYFVEAAGGGLKILGAWGEDYRLSATAEVVVADVAYNHFLAKSPRTPSRCCCSSFVMTGRVPSTTVPAARQTTTTSASASCPFLARECWISRCLTSTVASFHRLRLRPRRRTERSPLCPPNKPSTPSRRWRRKKQAATANSISTPSWMP